MSITSKARRGIYAAAISPLNPDGTLNAAALVAYCQYLLSEEGGCDGVAPCGTTGEGTSLSLTCKQALPRAFSDAGVPSDRVIFGTGAPSIGDAIGLTQAAFEAGYANVLVLPPYYYKSPTDDGVFAYYAQLIEAVGSNDLRVYLYHFPQMSATPLSVSLVLRLREEFGPIIAGLKDSSGDFAQSRAFIEATGGVGKDFDVFPSSEAMLWDGLEIGSAGVISGSTNAFAKLVQVAKSAPAGAEREAAMVKVKTARETAAKYNLIAAMKQIEAWRSGNADWVRVLPPLGALGADDAAGLRADLAALG